MMSISDDTTFANLEGMRRPLLFILNSDERLRSRRGCLRDQSGNRLAIPGVVDCEWRLFQLASPQQAANP